MTTTKHTDRLASNGWTLIYSDAKQAAYAHEAIRQGADEDCVGPGEEGWHWYNEGTGQVGDRLNLDLVAAAPELLEALGELLEYHLMLGNSADSTRVAMARAAIAKAEGRS